VFLIIALLCINHLCSWNSVSDIGNLNTALGNIIQHILRHCNYTDDIAVIGSVFVDLENWVGNWEEESLED
jgi:hydroxymethylpyrimidine pyrophosphatase-like HAD family hydrolase